MTHARTQRRVLIADDDRDIAAIIVTCLESMQVETVVASDGEQALRLLLSEDIDVAILDYTMPGKNGLQVCEEFKATERGKLVPVLMLTARDNLQDKIHALEKGVDDYLTKPFHYSELNARVRALCRMRELMLELTRKNEELKVMQERLIQQEKQAVVTQLAGSAAHALGQPLAAIMLNAHLLELLQQSDPKFRGVLESIKLDVKRMSELINNLREADASKSEKYYEDKGILDLKN